MEHRDTSIAIKPLVEDAVVKYLNGEGSKQAYLDAIDRQANDTLIALGILTKEGEVPAQKKRYPLRRTRRQSSS